MYVHAVNKILICDLNIDRTELAKIAIEVVKGNIKDVAVLKELIYEE